MLKFNIFDITNDGVEFNSIVEINPKSVKSMQEARHLLDLYKNKKVYVQPEDAEGVYFLVKPKPRGRAPVPDEVVIFIHEQFVVHKKTYIPLRLMIFKEFGLELKPQMIKNILEQKYYVDVPGIDDLREKAKAAMPKKPDRKKKITDEMKDEWYDLCVNENMSGNAIAKRYNVSSVSVNTELRRRLGSRK